MIDQETLQEVMEIGAARRAERRRFIKMASAGIAAAGGLSMLAACGTDTVVNPPSPTPSPAPATPAASDVAILNFALTLEYLEANYYSFAAFGTGLNTTLTTGVGTQGTVTGGHAVPFADATVASYAREIAQDELAHVLFLRGQLGTAAVAQPAINIDGLATTGAFAQAARAAGVANAAGLFDPFANDDTWLLGASLLTDVGVTAYKGSAALITSPVILDAAAGILGAEAYHSGLLRTLIYRRGAATPVAATATNNRAISEAISDARAKNDGTFGKATRDDQGVVNPSTVTVFGPTGASVGTQPAANLVPTDANSIVFGRTAPNVLNEVFLTPKAVTAGGFFPSGINGTFVTSNANG